MDETIIVPSPNWFQSSGLAVSIDNWLIYGGPSKSLCVLEPLPADSEGVLRGNQQYQAHVLSRAHPEKIVCVDISPEWPVKKAVLAGSADGTVKQWSLEKVQKSLKFKSTHSHDIHIHEKEEVTGIGYCNNGFAVTLGSHGHIVKWDLKSNVAKSYNQALKSFKPVCMACSPHLHLNVAVGTKQGVVFVLDLNGAERVIYKVRGQDDEIIRVSWCPQYDVTVRKALKESEKKSVVTERMEKIRQEPELPQVLAELDERVKKGALVEHFVKGKNNTEISEPSVKTDEVSEPTIKTDEVSEQSVKTDEVLESSTKIGVSSEQTPKPKAEVLDESGIGKTLPEDTFDESIVEEDDMFDIYKDHEADEFGHKKYQPEDIVVKVAEEKKEDDYLAECLKLKEDILKKKNQPEPSIEALVEALDKTHVDKSEVASTSQNESTIEAKIPVMEAPFTSAHIHKHLLASVGKHGSVRVWSKAGKLVSSCAVLGASGGKNQRNQRSSPIWTTLLWYKPDTLLIGDGKSQLLECNPLKMDCKNKLEWHIVHTQHKRGLYAIASNAPRVQSPDLSDDTSHEDQWFVWTSSQDRNLTRYSMKQRQMVSTHNSCGGFLYTIQTCPYDARKVAISVGDGAVRVWETDTLDEDETKLSPGHVNTYWNNVQGKVLTVAWHPTRENWLAFGTAESRVGLIDTSGKAEKPAKVLLPALTGGVYSLHWGEGNELYACAGGEAVVYKVDNVEEAPAPLRVELEGQKWELSTVCWYPHAVVCGSIAGAVAVLTQQRPHSIVAAAFVFNKMIHTIDWHPQETSSCSEESQYKNLMAVCSLDKANTIVILEYGDKEDGTKQLSTWKTLTGHKSVVSRVAWSPHVEALLLSTSQDGTVRIWNVVEGVCTSIFGGHAQSALGASWSAFPQLATKVLSGGGDCCLRLWDVADHPADAYDEKREPETKKEKKKRERKIDKKKVEDESADVAEDTATTALLDTKIKTSKKFLLPMIYKQMNPCKVNGIRKLLKKHLQSSGDGVGNDVAGATDEFDTDFIKIFGNMNELNDILDVELERHEDTGNVESWVVLNIFRGHIDAMIQRASQRDLLDPYILSVAPSVSFKYWKDVTQLYLAQIDRLVAKGEEVKLCANKEYGGPVYRKAATLLGLHDVKGAVNVLVEARLYKEAYVLCRTRYIDSIATETLQKWAEHSACIGNMNMAAACYIALGDLSQATKVLGRSNNEECLGLSADIAKVVGQNTFADHIEKKRDLIKTGKNETLTQNETEELEQLPSRVDLLVSDKDQSDVIDVKKEELQHPGKTEELLEELPSKMELLMKDNDKNEGRLSGGQGDQNKGDQKNGEAEVNRTQKSAEVTQVSNSGIEEPQGQKNAEAVQIEATNGNGV